MSRGHCIASEIQFCRENWNVYELFRINALLDSSFSVWDFFKTGENHKLHNFAKVYSSQELYRSLFLPKKCKFIAFQVALQRITQLAYKFASCVIHWFFDTSIAYFVSMFWCGLMFLRVVNVWKSSQFEYWHSAVNAHGSNRFKFSINANDVGNTYCWTGSYSTYLFNCFIMVRIPMVNLPLSIYNRCCDQINSQLQPRHQLKVRDIS